MNMDLHARTTPALDLAAELMHGISHPAALALRPQDAALLEGAERFRFGPGGALQGWGLGDGPVVCLVHGYGGLGVQMAPLARAIAARGYRALFFDAAGHGASAPGPVGFDSFIAASAALWDHVGGPVHAWVGHSAGGLAMMRARALHGVAGGRYVVISAPLFPYVPLERMRELGAPEAALEHVKMGLAEQFRTGWSRLAAGISFAPEDEGRPLLAIYDRDDTRVDHGDSERIAGLWRGCRIVKTEGLGHNRILQDAGVIEAVTGFL